MERKIWFAITFINDKCTYLQRKIWEKIQNQNSVPKESILSKKESVSSPHRLIQQDCLPLLKDPTEAQTTASPSLQPHKPQRMQRHKRNHLCQVLQCHPLISTDQEVSAWIHNPFLGWIYPESFLPHSLGQNRHHQLMTWKKRKPNKPGEQFSEWQITDTDVKWKTLCP